MNIKKSWLDKASVAAAMLSLVAAMIAGAITFITKKFPIDTLELAITPQEQVGRQQITKLENEMSILKAQVAELTTVPQSVKVSTRLKELDVKVSSIDEKLNALNKAIMASPEKALEIPMLRRDVLALQKQYENATMSLEREITRAYDTIKWVVGTIVLGIIGLVVSLFLRGKRE